MLEELTQKVDQLQKDIKTLLELQLQHTNTLTTYKDVGKFLDKTPRTIRTYIKKCILKEGEHFYRNEKGKIVFIPENIIKFKTSVKAKTNYDDKLINTTKVNHPAVANIVKGLR